MVMWSTGKSGICLSVTLHVYYITYLAIDILPFRNALKRFLLMNSFYSSKEYFNYQRYSIEN